MKLGKDEVGAIYFIGLIMAGLSAYIATYGLIINYMLTALGISLFFVALVICRIDILDHRRSKQAQSN